LGTIGGTYLTLINQVRGVIDADTAGALTINTGSTTTANAGLIEATGAGGLTIASAITNTGTLLASGGMLSITGGLKNLTGTTLNDGLFEADANSTLSINASSQIVTDNATLILNGANSAIQGGAPLEATLTGIGKTGVLEVLGGRNWTSSLKLSNAGMLDLAGGTFTTASLSSSGKISGFGTLAATVTSTGTITVQSHSEFGRRAPDQPLRLDSDRRCLQRRDKGRLATGEQCLDRDPGRDHRSCRRWRDRPIPEHGDIDAGHPGRQPGHHRIGRIAADHRR
jgi:hypothetical protein